MSTDGAQPTRSSRSAHRTLTGPGTRTLALLVAIAFLLRVGLVLVASVDPERMLQTDSAGYLALAGDLGSYLGADGEHLGWSLKRPPGYPLLLHLLMQILGFGIVGVALTQALLGALTVALVGVLGRRLHGVNAGNVAAGIVALDPTLVVQSAFVLAEALFTFLLVLATLLLTAQGADRRRRRAGLAGLILGVAVLVRPIALPLLPGLALAVLLRRDPLRERLVAATLVLGVAGALVGGMMLHNHARAGVATVSTVSTTNLLEYRAAGLAAVNDPDVSFLDRTLRVRDDRAEVERLNAIVAARLPAAASRAEEEAVRTDLALELLLADPAGTIQVVGEGVLMNMFRPTLAGTSQWRLFGSTRAPGELSTAAWVLAVAEAVVLGLLLLVAALGIVRLAARRDAATTALLLLPAVGLIVLSAGLESYARFRGPAMPFIALLAAIAMNATGSRSSASVPTTSGR